MNVAHADEVELVRAVLTAEGAPADVADLQAHWLAEADLRGHASHGLQRLEVIVERIRRGLIDPAADPEITWETVAGAVVDGRRGLGPWVATRAAAAVSERAATTGVALAAVRNANHLGLLAPYVERIAARGQIGIAFTTSEALVHPWNGARAMVGTNPIAVGVPADPEPFVLDMATGAVSMGRILDHRHRAEPLRPGWAIDERGEPTLDPDAARAISPFGGAKGYGLGLAFELIVAATTASALGREVTGTLDVEDVCNKGDLIVCIDCAMLGAPDAVVAVSTYLRAIRDTPAQPGGGSVTVPGDGARARRARHLRDGVQIADAVWEQVSALHREASRA